MFSGWFKKARRARILDEMFPREWREFIERNVWHYAHLNRAMKERVEKVTQVFVAEKHWAGAGLTVSDEMKVTIAAQASLLVLGLDEPYYFDGVPSMIVYPKAFRPRQPTLWIDETDTRSYSGLAWYRGPIVLSWQDVLASGRRAHPGYNVTLHEFAHYLDALDGAVDGVPPLSHDQESNWLRVTQAEYLRLVGCAQRQEETLLDYYGATSRVEFFAVATECFFEQPQELERRHGELYAVMKDFYRVDPAKWLPPIAAPDDRDARQRDSKEKVAAIRRRSVERSSRDEDTSALASLGNEQLFLLGLERLNEERYLNAERIFNIIILRDPSDAEAYEYRARARCYLGDYKAALADAEKSLELDPDNSDAYCWRGAARLGIGDLPEAKKDLDRALAENGNDPEAYFVRGIIWLRMGKPRKAVGDFSLSIAIRPHAAKTYYQRANAYRAWGNDSEANADLDMALQLDPHVAWRQ